MTRMRIACRIRAAALTATVLAALLALGACSERVEDPKAPGPDAREHTLTPLGTAASAPDNEPVVSAPAPTDRWLGQWNGPEGTFLKLAGGQGRYDITIQDLDGPRPFTGRAVGEHIEFERNGQLETLRATDGQATGMKWLADKKDCLTVRPGEGYCRD
ncbi:MAG: hypothetical protein ACOZE7_15470 [Pseudomonadota bacterium]